MTIQEISQSVKGKIGDSNCVLIISSLNGFNYSNETQTQSLKDLCRELKKNISFIDNPPNDGDYILLVKVCKLLPKGNRILNQEKFSDLERQYEVSFSAEYQDNLLTLFKI